MNTKTTWISLSALLAFITGLPAAQAVNLSGCRVVAEAQSVELQSPRFVFRLKLDHGLRAESLDNRATGSRYALDGGQEIEVDVGSPAEFSTVQWLAGRTRIQSQAPGELVVELEAEHPRLSALVRYAWDADAPVLRKFVRITNAGDSDIDRLLNVRLGDYAAPEHARLPENPGRGFPVYPGTDCFLSLAHPAGFAQVENGRIVLRQYPGVRLRPGQTLTCMETVFGLAARAGDARTDFTRYVRSRMRRVLRKHDRPYALLESFGGQPNADFWTTEQYLLDHLAKVEQSIREGGPRFDFYCTEFWHDTAGDLTTFHRKNFPQGYARVRDTILRLGMRPGLWIDSGGLPQWTIGDNPAVRECYTKGPGQGELCRTCEPINALYKKSFIQQVRENKVGLLKFDNLGPGCQPPCCNNPAHDHLPGPLYSVEAIHNAVIDFLRHLDAACPDVFLMLYWGYRSPWWLEYADTYFESGSQIEAATPTEFPAPHARDSVTHRLDQAQAGILDTPWLGKDSLGIWLSDWTWNSCVGKSRWQEGLIMDLCRGSLLAQVWTDTDWLSPAERIQLAEFLALFRANPDCFANTRFILGDPRRSEAYGYACSNGQRAFLAIHNARLADSVVTLPLGSACGLPAQPACDIYRWYPHPAKLAASAREMQIALRPFQVVLLEVVPPGTRPSLTRTFQDATMPTAFSEPSRALNLTAHSQPHPPEGSTGWKALRPVSAQAKATLTIRDDDSILASGENAEHDVYTVLCDTDVQGITAIMLEALRDPSLPADGPGRAENGNFALTDVRLSIAPKARPDAATEVKFASAQASFSQQSHGGWLIDATIDQDPNSGWSIFPKVSLPHAAMFLLNVPVDHAGKAMRLTFKLEQGKNRHGLGRFKLSTSTEKTPSLPVAYLPADLDFQATLPATVSGGELLLTGEKNAEFRNASVGGQSLNFHPVWSEKAYWACPWQAWRADVTPSQDARELTITIRAQQKSAAELHFLPKSK